MGVGARAAYAVRVTDPGPPETSDVRVTVFVRGHVQGVGFRWWTRSKAMELRLVGHARNLDDGRVEVLAQGPGGAVSEFVRMLTEVPATQWRPGRVTSAVCQYGEPRPGVSGFVEY